MDTPSHDTDGTATAATVTSLQQLRAVYDPPKQLVLDKEQHRLDAHARHFLEQSRLAVLHLRAPEGDVVPLMAGGAAGFVTVRDPQHLTLAMRATSWPASRLQRQCDDAEVDAVASNGSWPCGALFIVPGVKETLRLSGSVYLDVSTPDDGSDAPLPLTLTVHLDLRKNFFHCAKAFIRSRAWKTA